MVVRGLGRIDMDMLSLVHDVDVPAAVPTCERVRAVAKMNA